MRQLKYNEWIVHLTLKSFWILQGHRVHYHEILLCRYKKVQGIMWKETAISNAEWTGVRLRDLLLLAGVNPNDTRIKHVHLEGADTDLEGQCYGVSITFEKAMSPETIIAYSMNGTEIPRDHGAPLRCVVPGVVGARQVKWLKTIRLSDVESPCHWQQKDYRVFPTSVELGDELDWKSIHSIQEYPIQSAFCIPPPGTKVERAEGTVDVAGYAWSGGGRGIIRVEVSGDGGKTWQSAELEQDENQDLVSLLTNMYGICIEQEAHGSQFLNFLIRWTLFQDHMWAWTLFRASIKIPKGVNKMELVVKATDRCDEDLFNPPDFSAYNTQPETPAGIWNLRGLINNAWHRVEVEITD
ncbi:mo-co oxidoreductase dimerization domain protein [Ancylostoma duodenale]|uniref:Mo-co oxidoreductase dimerization domain protein n=1 Tax=Ancylostoma duodenale TaxID=51022 RepID=A0A0C2GZL4_9BILA|nr:mo-co oxidoreductase dimerization domain protein [Ancylostoma duodenale]